MKNHLPTPENSLGQRLKLEMKKRGVSSAELAKRADVKTSFIYDVISGKSANPSTIKLARVVESLGISLSHLLDMENKTDEQSFYSADYVSISRLNVDSSSGIKTNSIGTQETEPLLFRKAWIIDSLGAKPADIRVLSVRGDSMEPTLSHNDLILVDTKQKSPSSPGIFVLFDGLGHSVRRLEYITHQQQPRIKVQSDNPQYSGYECSATEASIIGRVVWFSREI